MGLNQPPQRQILRGLQTCAWAATGWHPGSHINASPNALAAPVSIACFGSGPVGANTTRLVLLKGNIVADSIGAMKMPGGYSCCINQMSIKIHQAPHSWSIISAMQQKFWVCNKQGQYPKLDGNGHSSGQNGIFLPGPVHRGCTWMTSQMGSGRRRQA